MSSGDIDFLFFPKKPSHTQIKKITKKQPKKTHGLLPSGQSQPEPKEQKHINKLTTLTEELRKALEAAGLKKWEMSIEGYLEASTGFLPGGKAGFKATITLSSG
ncbi:MAG TPA: hypothetical protein VNK44_06585 [Candidatus Nitrosotenuis sp.]|nr:hypothetical protein [Candidatus Nitrosotenuis sp.]